VTTALRLASRLNASVAVVMRAKALSRKKALSHKQGHVGAVAFEATESFALPRRKKFEETLVHGVYLTSTSAQRF
jgi:hypothetical protein